MAQLNSELRLAINDNDKTGLIVIVTAIWLSWTGLTLLIRLVSKLHVQRCIGFEELLVTLASIFASTASACILVAVKHGLGRKDIEFVGAPPAIILKLLWVTEIFYLIALTIAKGAALPLLAQLTPIKSIGLFCYVLSSVLVVWCIVSVMIIGSRCHSHAPWNDVSAAHCPSLYSRWVVVEVVSIILECTIFGLFVRIIAILRMRRSVKAKVIFAFAARLTIIAPTALRLVYLRQGFESSIHSIFASVDAIVATQTVMHYTTMAASFAYIKPFLRAFDSNMGATVKVDTVVSNANPSCPKSGRHELPTCDNDVKLPIVSMSHPTAEQLDSMYGYNSSFEDEIRPTMEDHQATVQQPRRTSHLRFPVTIDTTRLESHEASRPITPIIYKTQEWTVHTEAKGSCQYA